MGSSALAAKAVISIKSREGPLRGGSGLLVRNIWTTASAELLTVDTMTGMTAPATAFGNSTYGTQLGILIRGCPTPDCK